MKRKSEAIIDAPETKVSSVSKILSEESLSVEEIEDDIESFNNNYNNFIEKMTKSFDSTTKLNVVELAKELVKFKELNRKTQFRLNICREKTKETKDDINKNHLIMQNLLYEALHLQKETESCLDYKCLHETMDLLPINQFLTEAPGKYTKAENEHELMLNRLYMELDERKRLTDEIEESQKLARELTQDILRKKQAYTDVGSNLNLVFEATRPLEEMLGIPMHESDEHSEAIRKLEQPLYVIFLRLQSEAANFNMDIDVKSDIVSAAIQLHQDSAAYLYLEFQYNSEFITLDPIIKFDDSAAETMDSLSNISKEILSTANLRRDLFDEPDKVVNLADPIPWCQELAGLYENHKKLTKSKTLQTAALSETLLRIRTTISNRLLLAYHLHYNTITSSSRSGVNNLIFRDWKLVSKDTIETVAPNVAYRFCTTSSEDSKINHSFYLTALVNPPQLSKKSNILVGPLRVWVFIPDMYPAQNASFALSVDESELPKAHPNLMDTLQLVEMETNCYCDELVAEEDDSSQEKGSSVLSRQINRMCVAISLFWKQMDCNSRTNSSSSLSLSGKFPLSNRPFNTNIN